MEYKNTSIWHRNSPNKRVGEPEGVFFKSQMSIFWGAQQPDRKKIRKMATQHRTMHKMQSFGASSSALHPALPAPRIPTGSQRPPAPPRRCPVPGAGGLRSLGAICNHPRGYITTTFNFPASITFLMNCCYYRNVNVAS